MLWSLMRPTRGRKQFLTQFLNLEPVAILKVDYNADVISVIEYMTGQM